MYTEQITAAATLADLERLPITVEYTGETTPPNWGGQLCDSWRVDISGRSFEYFTGLGHRKAAPFSPPCTAPAGTIARLEWEKKHLKPTPPPVADILHCLALDAGAFFVSFYDWCDDYGYSPRDIHARDIYAACIRTADKLLDIFSREELARISALTADL